MKRVTSLLIGCSLALAGITFAQQPEEQQSPTKKKPPVEKTQRAEQPKANAERPHKGDANGANTSANANQANPEATKAKPQHGPHNDRNATKGNKAEATPKTEASVSKETNASSEAGASATVAPNKQAHEGRKGAKGEAAGNNAKTEPATMPATGASVNPGAGVAPNNQGNRQANVNAKGKAANKPAPEKVQQIRQQYTSFPSTAPARQGPGSHVSGELSHPGKRSLAGPAVPRSTVRIIRNGTTRTGITRTTTVWS